MSLNVRSPLIGSPPHMRGKAAVPISTGISSRITPAHAGKRCCRLNQTPRPLDHPRTCGEKKQNFLSFRSFKGSPPHMRGKVGDDSQHIRREGITPAHAGKSNIQNIAVLIFKDHPRTCGEKLVSCRYGDFCDRITPAHAGKSILQGYGL